MSNDLIKEMASAGKTLKEIGEAVGISRQRVHQILKATPELAQERLSVKRAPASKKRYELNHRLYGGMTKKEFEKSELRVRQARQLIEKRANAKRHGVPCDIGWGDVEWPSHCPVLGVELDYFRDFGIRDNYATLDKIDPALGYVQGNVAVLSARANRIKDNGTAEEHRKIAEYIDKYKNKVQP